MHLGLSSNAAQMLDSIVAKPAVATKRACFMHQADDKSTACAVPAPDAGLQCGSNS